MTALAAMLQTFREPVPSDTRRALELSRRRVPAHLRTATQMLGRSSTGCGATIGAMPRCDFACTGCYLGKSANKTPPFSLDRIKTQMRALRATLGDRGNLQLTDGEILLRPVEDVIELLRYARRIGLAPIVMTHGDALRRQRGLLEHLIKDGGLDEISIHIDTTQRGRMGAYKYARTERDLMPLRDEFADMIRRARRVTGRPLRAASTMTVTAQNLAEIPAVIEWMKQNTDVFRMISFQPVAQVGRTRAGLGGSVSVDQLWDRITAGLAHEPDARARVASGKWWMGHPACNRIVTGLVSAQVAGVHSFHPIRETGNAMDEAVVDWVVSRFGRVTFRGDDVFLRLARLAGLFVRAPRFVLANAGPYALHWLRRFDRDRPWRFAWSWARRRATVYQLTILSHHFMSREETFTQEGKERLSLCVFHVPVNERMVPMCEVNALGVRDELYASSRRQMPDAGHRLAS